MSPPEGETWSNEGPGLPLTAELAGEILQRFRWEMAMDLSWPEIEAAIDYQVALNTATPGFWFSVAPGVELSPSMLGRSVYATTACSPHHDDGVTFPEYEVTCGWTPWVIGLLYAISGGMVLVGVPMYNLVVHAPR